MPWAGNIAKTDVNGKQLYPRNVYRCCTWSEVGLMLSLESLRVFQNLFCFCYVTNHSMTGPLGNSEFVSLESRDEVEGNIEILGKQNTLFPSGPVIKVPSTIICFQTKTELFCSGYGYRPHYNAENDHRKRSHSKTLYRVECVLKSLFSSVDRQNNTIWKRWRWHDRAPDHSTVSIQNGGQTLPCGFSLERL